MGVVIVARDVTEQKRKDIQEHASIREQGFEITKMVKQLEAVDYVLKSETAFMKLQKIISNIVVFKKINKPLNWYRDKMWY